MGPLLAGLAGFGWAMLPPFVAVFVMWLMLLRPHQWPRSNREWMRPASWLAALGQVLSQVALVAALFGAGRGIGGVLGELPMVFPLFPLSISFLSVPLSRMLWDADDALHNGITIDEMMYPKTPKARMAGPAPVPQTSVAQLLELPDDAALGLVGLLLEEALDTDDAWARLSDLCDALEAAPGRYAALRQALVLLATDPENFAANVTPSAMRSAFRAAGSDLRLLQLLLPRAAVLARVMPERHGEFPDLSVLAALTRLDLPGQLASDLAALRTELATQEKDDVPPPAPMQRIAMGQAQTT
ncbi:MAG: hypothetical protein WAT09_03010 [Paracoccaceae bacterium]